MSVAQEILESLLKLQKGEKTWSNFWYSEEKLKIQLTAKLEKRAKCLAETINSRLHFQLLTVYLTQTVLPHIERSQFD